MVEQTTPIEVRVREKLASWPTNADEDVAIDALPTADEIQEVVVDLGILRQEDTFRATDLGNSLEGRLHVLKALYTRAFHRALSQLQAMVTPAPNWRDVVKQAEQIQRELRTIAPDLEVQYANEVEGEKQRLEDLELPAEITQDVSSTTQELRSKEARQDFSSLVEDALRLYERVITLADRIRRRKQPTAWPEILEQLRELEKEAREFWDQKRGAYEEALTADQANDFQYVYSTLVALREKEGADAKVLYFGSRLEKEARQVPIDKALEVCIDRWIAFQGERVTAHLDQVASKLAQYDPRGAGKLLREVYAPEKRLDLNRLSDEVKLDLNKLGAEVEVQLAEIQRFENEVAVARAKRPVQEAWRDLLKIGQEYERFQKASPVWKSARSVISDAFESQVWQSLRSVSTLILRNELDQAATQLATIDVQLQPSQAISHDARQRYACC